MENIEKENNSFERYLEIANRTYGKLGNLYENVGGILDIANSTYNTIENATQLFDPEKLEKAYDNIQEVETINFILKKTKRKFYILWLVIVILTVSTCLLL